MRCRSVALAINGEIYNHEDLKPTLADKTAFRTRSDCEVVVHLYKEIGEEVASKLDGDFAFALAGDKGEFYAARDPIGVASMYMGWGADGSVWFASEMKTLVHDCKKITQFPPGHYWSRQTKLLHRYYHQTHARTHTHTHTRAHKMSTFARADFVQNNVCTSAT